MKKMSNYLLILDLTTMVELDVYKQLQSFHKVFLDLSVGIMIISDHLTAIKNKYLINC